MCWCCGVSALGEEGKETKENLAHDKRRVEAGEGAVGAKKDGGGEEEEEDKEVKKDPPKHCLSEYTVKIPPAGKHEIDLTQPSHHNLYRPVPPLSPPKRYIGPLGNVAPKKEENLTPLLPPK